MDRIESNPAEVWAALAVAAPGGSARLARGRVAVLVSACQQGLLLAGLHLSYRKRAPGRCCVLHCRARSCWLPPHPSPLPSQCRAELLTQIQSLLSRLMSEAVQIGLLPPPEISEECWGNSLCLDTWVCLGAQAAAMCKGQGSVSL